MIPLAFLVQILVLLVVFGLIVWIIRQIPLDAWIKNCIYVLLVIVLLLYAVSLLPIGAPLLR